MMCLLPEIKTWSIRRSPPKVFFKKFVLQIRRKLHNSHHIFRCCYSVMDTKILEDLENINVKENKHES